MKKGDLKEPHKGETFEEQLKRVGQKWGFPGYEDPPEKKNNSDEKEKITITFPSKGKKELLDELKRDRKLKGIIRPGKLKIDTVYDGSVTKPTNCELDETQKWRIKMSKKSYNFMKRAIDLRILSEDGRAPVTEKKTPTIDVAKKLLCLFLTEIWWILTDEEKEEYGYKPSKGLTNYVIKRYIVDSVNPLDKPFFESKAFNITTVTDSFLNALHNNWYRGKKRIPGLLEITKLSTNSKILKPDPSLRILGYSNMMLLLSTKKPTAVNMEEAKRIISESMEKAMTDKKKESISEESPPAPDNVNTKEPKPEEPKEKVYTSKGSRYGVQVVLEKYEKTGDIKVTITM